MCIYIYICNIYIYIYIHTHSYIDVYNRGLVAAMGGAPRDAPLASRAGAPRRRGLFCASSQRIHKTKNGLILV